MKKLLQAVLLVVFVLGTVMQPGFANVVLDSDADGLSDTDEINIYGTDPNNPDTDGDGIDDYAEINFDDGSELNDDLRIAVNSSYALSGDAGSGWVENALNPIMTGTEFCGGPANHKFIAFPRVEEINGAYQMWFNAYGFHAPSSFNICHADSNNGLDWTKTLTGNDSYDSVLPHGGQPGIDDGGVSFSDVIYEAGLYTIYYQAVQAGNVRACRATATDGINWVYDQNNPVLEQGAPGEWDQGTIGWPTVINTDSNYYMFYNSFENWSPPSPLGAALSVNGSNWSKYEGNPLLAGGEFSGIGTFEVEEYEDGYLMFYVTGDEDQYLRDIRMVYSEDLLEWTEADGSILDNNGEFISGGSVLPQDNLYVLYYMTTNPNDADEGHINVAFNYKPSLAIVSSPEEVVLGEEIEISGSVLDTGNLSDLCVAVYDENGTQLGAPVNPDGYGDVVITVPTAGLAEGVRQFKIRVTDEGQLFSEEEVDVNLYLEVGIPEEADDAIPVDEGQGDELRDPDQEEVVVQPSTVWYLAEGHTGSLFDEYVLIQNPNSEETLVRVTFMKEDGTTVTEDIQLDPTSRYTIHVNNKIDDSAVSTKVESLDGKSIIAERSMYWNTGELTWGGGHNAPGITQLSREWYLAEGSVDGFDLYVLVMNPGEAEASVKVTYMLPDSSTVEKQLTVGAHSRYTIHVNEDLTATAVSTKVESTVDIAVERAMYWNSGDFLWAEGHVSTGVVEPSTEWFLAEGCTLGSFDQWILLMNPNAEAVVTTVTYMLADGSTQEQEILLAATSRATVHVNDQISGEVSTHVQSALPIIVERAMYWNSNDIAWAGGSNSQGSAEAGTQWFLAEGFNNDDFSTWVLIMNPNDVAAEVKVTFMKEGGETIEQYLTIAATSRFTIDTKIGLTAESFSVRVESLNEISIITERAMYWNCGDYAWKGGHSSVGVK